MKKPKKPRSYINNANLYEAMVLFHTATVAAKKADTTLPVIPNYVGECFLKICNKLASKGNFASYTYKDEMISDGIENLVVAAHSFDPSKSNNPFAYFTQIAWNAFIRRIGKEKKQTYLKHKNYENNDLLSELMHDSFHVGQKANNDYSDDIIRTFESKMVKEKKKTKVGLEKFIGDEENEEYTSDSADGD